MRPDKFNQLIPIDLPEEQKEQYKEILVANALKFFQAGGVLTLDAWVELSSESQDAFIEAQARAFSVIESLEEDPVPEVKQENKP